MHHHRERCGNDLREESSEYASMKVDCRHRDNSSPRQRDRDMMQSVEWVALSNEYTPPSTDKIGANESTE